MVPGEAGGHGGLIRVARSRERALWALLSGQVDAPGLRAGAARIWVSVECQQKGPGQNCRRTSRRRRGLCMPAEVLVGGRGRGERAICCALAALAFGVPAEPCLREQGRGQPPATLLSPGTLLRGTWGR